MFFVVDGIYLAKSQILRNKIICQDLPLLSVHLDPYKRKAVINLIIYSTPKNSDS